MRFMVLLLLSYSILGGASPNNFAQAKKIAERLFKQHPQTIYCQCLYRAKKVDLDSCSMQSATRLKRAHRIEWDHIMAAEHFGKQFECWNKPLCEKKGRHYKGRACCEKIDSQFRHIESELYNLWPVVGLVNQARSNYHFVASLDKETIYGCGLKIDTLTHKAEPPNHAKGVVARAYLFMAYFYGLNLKAGEYELFLMWHKEYPPSAWEITWAHDVAAIEGYINPYISANTL